MAEDTKVVTHNVQIFPPGVHEDTGHPIISVDSAAPLMPLSIGDLINPRYSDISHLDELKDKLLRVTSVEHGINTVGEEIRHYVRIYTKAEPDTPEVLLGG